MRQKDYCERVRNEAYAKRIGQVYGGFRVKSIRYDDEKKKQEWTLVCEKCGAEKVTTSWQNYVNGRGSRCKCEKSKEADISLRGIDALDDVRRKAYQERIGKVYGDYTVIDVLWDSEKRKQMWVLQCNHCGIIKPTYSWQNYVNGRSGHCKNCDRADNTLIGCRNGGFEVKRCWVDNDEIKLEMGCEYCGKLVKAGYWQYVNEEIVCNCRR